MNPIAEKNEDPCLEELAEEMIKLFPPVRPLPAHKQRLREGLVGTMRNRGNLRIASSAEQRRLAFVSGAIVGSLLSLFGLVAYLLYRRADHGPGKAIPV